MCKLLVLFCTTASLCISATTIDRIVAVAGKRAIKQSDLERDLRVTQFLNRAAPDFSIAARKEALDRLIDQELIRAELASAANTGHLEKEAKAVFDGLLKQRFGGSEARLEAELKQRGFSRTQLLQHLQWQLVVLQFIDQRFRPGVVVDPAQVREYYDQHLQQLKEGSGDRSYEALAPAIRENLEAEAVNRNFEEWLDETRKNVKVEYKVSVLK